MDKCGVLYRAVLGGYEQLVSDVLTGGAHVNVRYLTRGHAPLFVAADRGYDEIISSLLLAGANKDALTNYGETPLLLAAMVGHPNAAKTLMAADAGLNMHLVLPTTRLLSTAPP